MAQGTPSPIDSLEATKRPLPRPIWLLAFLTFLAAWRLGVGSEPHQLGAAAGTAAIPLGISYLAFRRWRRTAFTYVVMIFVSLWSLSCVEDPRAARKAQDAFLQQVEGASARTKVAIEQFGEVGGTDLTGLTTATQVEERLRLARGISSGSSELWDLLATDDPLRRALEREGVSTRVAGRILSDVRSERENSPVMPVLQAQRDWCGAAETFFHFLQQHFGEWQVDEAGALSYAASADERFRRDADAARARLGELEKAWTRASEDFQKLR